MLSDVLGFFLNLDTHLNYFLNEYGVFTYLILFSIIFIETGLVIAPFLPGDTLIFIAGILASQKSLNLIILLGILSTAAILGDAVNYWIGRIVGEKFMRKHPRFFKPEFLKATEEFYKKYGKSTIILARFVPIVRTFAPWIAGIGRMNYYDFSKYNIFGGILWVVIFLFGGYFFGNIEFVRNNLNIVVLIIIFISLIPLIKSIFGKKQ